MYVPLPSSRLEVQSFEGSGAVPALDTMPMEVLHILSNVPDWQANLALLGPVLFLAWRFGWS